MPRVSRRRRISAPLADVWDLVSDPYSLPRWWPRTARVENVESKPAGKRSEWTAVLQTAEGRGVRADYRCLGSTEGRRYAWEQRLEGTPFERHLRRSVTEVEMQADDQATEVRLTAEQRLRGMSRLGGLLMRRGQGAILEEALDGLERALGGDR